ncbi:unnamed protein product [Closterium sp. NIES-53]
MPGYRRCSNRTPTAPPAASHAAAAAADGTGAGAAAASGNGYAGAGGAAAAVVGSSASSLPTRPAETPPPAAGHPCSTATPVCPPSLPRTSPCASRSMRPATRCCYSRAVTARCHHYRATALPSTHVHESRRQQLQQQQQQQQQQRQSLSSRPPRH